MPLVNAEPVVLETVIPPLIFNAPDATVRAGFKPSEFNVTGRLPRSTVVPPFICAALPLPLATSEAVLPRVQAAWDETSNAPPAATFTLEPELNDPLAPKLNEPVAITSVGAITFEPASVIVPVPFLVNTPELIRLLLMVALVLAMMALLPIN